MKARVNRRTVMRWMLAAPTVGGLSAANLSNSTTISHNAASRVNFERIRTRIQQAIAHGEATGVAVAVVREGRIVWEEGFGWADRETKLKATQHTPFSMASITKPFTTTTLMTLVAEGKLLLDEPANQYLPEAKITSTNGLGKAATVRMLGAHVSGLPGMYESYEADEARLAPSPNALLQAYGRLAYPPAACYEYSNIGYAALSAIALALTRIEFGALMATKVLVPLGLHNSFFGSDTVRAQSDGAKRYDSLSHPHPALYNFDAGFRRTVCERSRSRTFHQPGTPRISLFSKRLPRSSCEY